MRAKPLPKHVRLRTQQREVRCRAKGFASYDAYLGSPAWQRAIERYRQSDEPQVCICGAEPDHVHHLTYDRVGGDELPADLRGLCAGCHMALHALERRGDTTLNPDALLDMARAEENRRILAQPPVFQEHEHLLAYFHYLPLTVRLSRLLTLPAVDRAPIASELRVIRNVIRQAHARRRGPPVLRLDRYAWQAAEVLAERRPMRTLLTPWELRMVQRNARRLRARSMSAEVRCALGHQTQWPNGREQLPCGCVRETATAEALEAAGMPQVR